MLLILLLTALTFGTAEASADDELKSRIYTVAFAQDTLSNDWRRAQIKAFAERFAAHPNIRFIYSDGEGQTTKQISDIEDFIYQQVDVLITSPRDTLVSAPAIARAYATGIPVVLVTRAIDNESYTTLVAPSDYLIGHRAGSYLAKHIGERGRVLMLRGVPTTSTAQARTQGFLDAIERYPGIVLAAVRDGNYLRADAIRETEQVLSEGIAFDAIYAQSDSMASGARMALRKAGLDPKSKLIVGIDYIDEAREAIRRGEQAASFVYPTCAEEAVQAVLAILDGRTVPKHIEVSTMLVDKHNVDQVEPVF
jgi:ribose transport system substrate-binding protein